MKTTKILSIAPLLASLGFGGCEENNPVGVPDEVETEEGLEGWSEDMVKKARTEVQPPKNVDKDYRPSAREEPLSGQAEDFADEATEETPPETIED